MRDKSLDINDRDGDEDYSSNLHHYESNTELPPIDSKHINQTKKAQ